MRRLISLLALAQLSTAALAQEEAPVVYTPPPVPLRDSQIELHRADGTSQAFDGNDFKVVSRRQRDEVQAKLDALRRQLAEAEAERADAETRAADAEARLAEAEAQLKDRDKLLAAPAKAPEPPPPAPIPAPEPSRNRVMGYVGLGPEWVVVDIGDCCKDVDEETQMLVGAGYQRLVTDRWSLGGLVTTGLAFDADEFSGLLGLGYDF